MNANIIAEQPWSPISRGKAPFEVTLDSVEIGTSLPFYSEYFSFSSQSDSSPPHKRRRINSYSSTDSVCSLSSPSEYFVLRDTPPNSPVSSLVSPVTCSESAQLTLLLKTLSDLLVGVHLNPGPCSCSCCSALWRAIKALLVLVGVEPNPGPKGGGKQMVVYVPPKNQAKKTKQRTQVSSLGSSAIPGRFPVPRSLGTPQQLLAYMRCLNDPFNVPPVRPGVMCAVPTGLFTAYLRIITSAVNNSGVWSMTVLPHRLQFPIMTSTTAASPYTYINNYVSYYPQYNAVTALYEKARLLAAGLRIIPTQPSLSDNGSISACLLPGGRLSAMTNTGIVNTTAATQGFNEIPNYPQTLTSPFKVGATVFWRPQDPNSFAFREATLTDTNTVGGAGGVQETLQDIPYFMAGFAGCAANATFTIELIAHFEGTVGYGNAGVIELQRAAPVNDGDAMRAVDRVFTDDNRTAKPGYLGPFNERIAGISSSSGKRRSGGGGMLKDIMSFGSSVAPLLSLLL